MIEYKTPDRTIDDVLRDYESIFRGRTRYAGQKPRDDELLVAEIKRLRDAERVLWMLAAIFAAAGAGPILLGTLIVIAHRIYPW